MINDKFKSSYINTPLGTMLAIASDEELYLLSFVDNKNDRSSLHSDVISRHSTSHTTADDDQIIKQFQIKTKSIVTPGTAAPIISIKSELKSYFQNKLKVFKTPINLIGTTFQKAAWNSLIKIPYGQTRSYREQAIAIERPSAYRAVANANGANQIVIVVPCHRIITTDGKLGGYSAGIERKKWLLNHESVFVTLRRDNHYTANHS